MIQLKKMNQEGSVEEYQREFEKVRFQAHCSEEQALDMFLRGLKEKLEWCVVALHPTSVIEAFHYATLYETAFSSDTNPAPAMTTFKQNPTYNRNQSAILPTPSYQRKPLNPTTTVQANFQPNQYTKPQNQVSLNNKPKKLPLTDAEYKEKRAKNQCFWCESKFTPGQNCERDFIIWKSVV